MTITVDAGYRTELASGSGINAPFGFSFDTCGAGGGFTGPGTCNVKQRFTPTSDRQLQRLHQRLPVPRRRRHLHPDHLHRQPATAWHRRRCTRSAASGRRSFPSPASRSGSPGSAMPVYFELGGASGTDIFDAGYPTTTPIDCTTRLPIGPSQPLAANEWVFQDLTAGVYHYKWKSQAGLAERLPAPDAGLQRRPAPQRGRPLQVVRASRSAALESSAELAARVRACRDDDGRTAGEDPAPRRAEEHDLSARFGAARLAERESDLRRGLASAALRAGPGRSDSRRQSCQRTTTDCPVPAVAVRVPEPRVAGFTGASRARIVGSAESAATAAPTAPSPSTPATIRCGRMRICLRRDIVLYGSPKFGKPEVRF